MPFNYLPDILEQRKEDAYRLGGFSPLPNVTAKSDVAVTSEMRSKGPKSFRNKNRAVNETNAISGPLGGYAPGSNPAERTQAAAGGMDVNAPSRGLMGAMNPNNLGADFARYAGQQQMDRYAPAMPEVANTNAPQGTFQPTSTPQIPNAPSAGMNAQSPGLGPGGYERISSQGHESEPIRGPLPPIYNNSSYVHEDPMEQYAGKVQEAQAKFNEATGKKPSMGAPAGPLTPQDLATPESGIGRDPYTDLQGELAPPPDPRIQAEDELHKKSAWWRAGQFGLGLLGGLASGNPLAGLYYGIEGARGTPFIQQRMGEIEQQQEAKRNSAVDRFNIQKQMDTRDAAEDRNETNILRATLGNQQEMQKAELQLQKLEAQIDRWQVMGANEKELNESRKEAQRLRKTIADHKAVIDNQSILLRQRKTDSEIPLNEARRKDIEAGTQKKQAETKKIQAGGAAKQRNYTDRELAPHWAAATEDVKKQAAKEFDDTHGGSDWAIARMTGKLAAARDKAIADAGKNRDAIKAAAAARLEGRAPTDAAPVAPAKSKPTIGKR